ncbi:cyclopropane-fatty-acyl-phospholipid synthase family protein, partial [Rickettsiales bacterium]|nr:cyclopropane-fatty-acyl-phospholipid synthase family protein [Rickettsiales bacterium]
DGETHIFEGKIQNEPKVDFVINNSKVITNLLAKGDVGFAMSYRDGDFHTNDLSNLLIIAIKNADILENYIYGGFFSNIAAQFLYYMRSNTIKGSKRNIHAHYDLGNDFYSLWLDPTMSYSAALFKNKNESLQYGQLNKYDRIIERLEKQSGNLLEVGCGWGGFAERALDHGDYGIKGITISSQQHQYANTRLGKRASIVIEDYRKQTGKYDNIVSIEMFEAVGEKYWPVYFNKMKSLLSNKGKAVVQTITIEEPYFERYRKTGDMVRSFIFPGGMLPSVTRFKQEAEKAGLQVVDNFKFGQDYAATLRHWLQSFEDNIDKVKSLGFDESFIRIWRFYLAACIASFSASRTNVIQAEISHA